MDESARHRLTPHTEGMVRLALAAVIALLVSLAPSPSETWPAYAAVGLAAVFGALLISGRQQIVPRERLAYTALDAVVVGALVVGTGGEGSPFLPLYFLAALGIVRIGDPSRAAIAAVAVVGSYLFAVAGGDQGLLWPFGAGLLALICAAAGVVGFEWESLRERNRGLSSILEAERGRVEKAESVAGRLGPALKFMDLEGILQWTAETAHAVGGGTYAHVAALNGNHHRTVQDGDFDVCPSWWHPAVQRLVLWSCREGETVRSEEEIHGIKGFVAVPIGTAGGSIVLGGGDFGAVEERALALIAREVAPALEHAEEAPGGLDPLSGLPNRASLLRVLQRELSLGRKLTVLAVGLSGIRHYNQVHGYAAGEELLRRIGARLGSWQRTFRYGEGEFVVVLGGADEGRARQVALGIEQLVSNETEGSGPGPLATVGLSFASASEEDPDSLVREALRAGSRAGELARHQIGTPEDGTQVVEAARAFIEPLESRDPDIGNHLGAVSRLALRIGLKMSLSTDQLDSLTLGALLHDVGKIGIPDGILQKPDALTDDEYGIIKRHPALGARMLAAVEELAPAVPVVRHHHERFDGTGYPDGLGGEDIPLAARIVSVADAFDSMVRHRPYGYGVPRKDALREIEKGSGSQFDPRVVEALLAVMWEPAERRAESAG